MKTFALGLALAVLCCSLLVSGQDHQHSEKNPHHDDSHSHEDSKEHARHARSVESERFGSGSYSQGGHRGSGLGSGSLHGSSGHGSSGLGHSSGFGQGSSGLGHSSGLGGGSLHGSSGHHGSSGLGSGSLHGSSGSYGRPGSGHHGSSGLGSGSFYQGGHGRRPLSVSSHADRGTIYFQDNTPKSDFAWTDMVRSAEVTYAPPTKDTLTLTNDRKNCVYSNLNQASIANRTLECDGTECELLVDTVRYSLWRCGQFRCNLLNFDPAQPLPEDVIQCFEDRHIIQVPPRCPPGSKLDHRGKCRQVF